MEDRTKAEKQLATSADLDFWKIQIESTSDRLDRVEPLVVIYNAMNNIDAHSPAYTSTLIDATNQLYDYFTNELQEIRNHLINLICSMEDYRFKESEWRIVYAKAAIADSLVKYKAPHKHLREALLYFKEMIPVIMKESDTINTSSLVVDNKETVDA